MRMDRWNPMTEMMGLREAMERVVQDSFVRAGQALATVSGEQVFVDVADMGSSYLLRASLPGVSPDDVQVMAQGNSVTIRGERPGEGESAEQHWVMRERRAGPLERTVTLPAAVNAAQAEARYEHGVLSLTLPKAPEAQARHIRVGSSGAASAGAPASAVPAAVAVTPGPTTPPVPAAAPNAAPGGTGAPPIEHSRVDPVTEASMESFPASDPPAWTSKRG